MLTVFVTGEVNDTQLAQIKAPRRTPTCAISDARTALEARIEEAEVVAGNITRAGPRAGDAVSSGCSSWAAGPDT